jgi:predicted O-methyltransferase YrrM
MVHVPDVSRQQTLHGTGVLGANMLHGLQHHIETVVSAERMPETAFSGLVRTQARYLTRAAVLEICVRLADSIPGNIVEFGVADGASTRVIRKSSGKKIYALDSFEGLQEKFENAEVGAFAGPVPDIPGVTIVKGFFQDTCTDALRQEIQRVAFAHLDADLYNSTICALRWLTPMLGNGSLLLFDEFTGGDKAEARAFADWQRETETILVRIAEFDREASGWGAVPDKRLLFQVLLTQPSRWRAKSSTFLKAVKAMTYDLPPEKKIAVSAGQCLDVEQWETAGDHVKLNGAKLDNRELSSPDWFIYGPHWEQISPK